MKSFFVKNKKFLALILAVILAVGVFGVSKCFGDKSNAVLKAALLYSKNSTTYVDTFSHLEQSFLANCTFEKIDVNIKTIIPIKYIFNAFLHTSILYVSISVNSFFSSFFVLNMLIMPPKIA